VSVTAIRVTDPDLLILAWMAGDEQVPALHLVEPAKPQLRHEVSVAQAEAAIEDWATARARLARHHNPQTERDRLTCWPAGCRLVHAAIRARAAEAGHPPIYTKAAAASFVAAYIAKHRDPKDHSRPPYALIKRALAVYVGLEEPTIYEGTRQ
jgi:hypothetical protein